jgi:uncharacterized membrane protein
MKSPTLTCITAITLFAALAVPVRLAAQQTRDKLIEIGTSGDPLSGFVGVGTQPLNNAAVAPGGADTPTPDSNAPNCFGDCFITQALQKGVLVDLGALLGVNNSGANDINANGVVTGISQNSAIDPITGFPEFDTVFWKDSQIINLGTFGGNWDYANAINNLGQVAGCTEYDTRCNDYRRTGDRQRLFRHSRDTPLRREAELRDAGWSPRRARRWSAR